MKTTMAAVSLMLTTGAAFAVAGDECQKQRAEYPKNWKDTRQETALFTCRSHYSGAFVVKLGATDGAGRVLMSLSPVSEDGQSPNVSSAKVFRIWLDKEQADRLKQGKYFATVVRKEASCWIRGDLNKDTVFFMDNVDPAPDSPDAGSFYNKAPRFSVFQGDSYACEPVK